MKTVIIVAVVLVALVLIAGYVLRRAATNKLKAEEQSRQAIRESKARTERFQSYIADDLSRSSRVQRATPVSATARKQIAPVTRKREESSSAYYGDETIAYEAPSFGYVDSSPSYNYSDDSNSSSSSGSSSSYDSGSSYGGSSSSSYDSGSSSSSSDSGSSW
jgi:uncharacterized membrane protein YgcG